VHAVSDAEVVLANVHRQLEPLGMNDRAGVVAVSGGPDSVALLRALALCRSDATIGPLVVAHLNHQLRGVESDADEEFVRGLHARLAANDSGLLWRSQRLDVADLARRQGISLESAGRKARYDWFATVAVETGAAWVATGHTADDQAETVLHRLLRGTGLRGLAGIPARRPLRSGVEVVRPLLRVRRRQVLAFLESLDQPWRPDSSNADLRHTRNRLRHELLPLLAQRYNPAVVAVLGRLAGQAAQACQLMEGLAAALLQEVELPPAGNTLVLDGSRLEQAPLPLVRELFRLLWLRQGWPLGEMGFREWQRLALIAQGKAKAADLPGHVTVRRRGRVVQLRRP
jgi:tRNA(Ile)-lysidine synthase